MSSPLARDIPMSLAYASPGYMPMLDKTNSRSPGSKGPSTPTKLPSNTSPSAGLGSPPPRRAVPSPPPPAQSPPIVVGFARRVSRNHVEVNPGARAAFFDVGKIDPNNLVLRNISFDWSCLGTGRRMRGWPRRGGHHVPKDVHQLRHR